jgi:GABA permease
MITLGGMIGAGLFVGSSAAMAHAGPAALLTYILTRLLLLIVMRCLGEMVVALPEVRSFVDLCYAGLGPRTGFYIGICAR